MATSAEVVKQQVQDVAAGNGGGSAPKVFDLIHKWEPAMREAMTGTPQDVERFVRIAITTVRTTPKLLDCDAVSIIGALMVSAQLGLEPGGPLGHAYLVPYGRECQFQLGYKGIIELSRRSGQLSSIEAHEVCDGDDFSFAYGLDDHLTHMPDLRGDRGQPYAYYSVAKFKDGGHAFVVLSKGDIERHRQRSKMKDRGAWVSDYDAMARKTCIRVMAPYLPLSPQLERALSADERSFPTTSPDLADLPALEAGDDRDAGGVSADGGPPDQQGADQ